MVTTIPNTEELIPDEVLNELSLGTLQALQLRLAQRQHEKILEPTAYENFARHSLDTGIDWGTQWAAAPPGPSVAPDSSDTTQAQSVASKGKHAGPTPSAPDDYYNTLPGMIDNLVTARRVQDATIASLTGIADRAYALDRDTMLGIPAGVNMFKTGKRWLAHRFQVDSRQMGKFYSRAELITAEHPTIAGIGREPLLPQMAAAYAAGTIPSENMDRMTHITNQLYDFYQAVGLSKENATEILQTMDPVFTEASQRMTSAQLAEESTKWLHRIAHIVDPDGPPPEERLTKVSNSLHTRIINGKLHINIVTDVVNTELIEALILAGLNYKANQNTFRQNSAGDDGEEPSDTQATSHETDVIKNDSAQASPHVAEEPVDDTKNIFTDTELDGSTPNDDAHSAEERLALFHQRMDDAINDPETFVETPEGESVSRDELRALDPRSRAEKAHDVFMTILKAQGKRSPGADGMPEYKRAPAILWTVMDYETLLRMQQDRLESNYGLDSRYQRPPGLAGPGFGQPTTLDPLQAIVAEHAPPGTSDPETILGSDPLLSPVWQQASNGQDPPDGQDRARSPDEIPRRGHRYVSRRFQTGSVSPGAVLQDLCDAKIIPAIFNQAGVPLFLGRGKRLFSDDQILAAGMLGGCRGPGCRIPPVWTEGHHGIYWAQNGGTNTTNLILLCNACHTKVHQGVWTPTWNNEGVLYWIPAPWLDPTQTPIRNTYWDL